MIPYGTPEWVEAVGKNYQANPDNQGKTFKDMTLFLTYRILADDRFGIDRDLYFCSHLVKGALQTDSALISKESAEEKSDFILSASPETWKRLIKKQQGFISLVMTSKIKLDKGMAPKLLSLAPKSGPLVDVFHRVDTEWPDEMPPGRLEEYRVQLALIREDLGV